MAEHDAALLGAPDSEAEAEVEFVARLADLGVGEQVLDVGCGAGRHAILMQERGARVTGVDLSPRLLRLARDAWERRNPSAVGPVWMPGDMRWLPRTGPFDVATLLGHAFGVFDEDADNLRVLLSVSELLDDAGRLVLSLNNPYYWADRLQTRHFPPGSVAAGDVIRSWRFDHSRGRLEERTVLFGPKGRRELSSSLRCWTPPELVALLRHVGYRVVHVYGSDGWEVPEDPMPVNADAVTLWVYACR